MADAREQPRPGSSEGAPASEDGSSGEASAGAGSPNGGTGGEGSSTGAGPGNGGTGGDGGTGGTGGDGGTGGSGGAGSNNGGPDGGGETVGGGPIGVGDLLDGSLVGGVLGNLDDSLSGGLLGQGGLLDDTLGAIGNNLGGGLLGDDGLLNGGLVDGALTSVGNALDTVGDTLGSGTGGLLGGGLVSDAAQTVGAIGGAGSIDGILNAAGAGTGELVDDALGAVAGNGTVGGVLNAIGDDLATGTVGGAGLLAGTPLAGLQGDGALISGNTLRGDDSSSANLIEVGAGTDQSQGLINLDAASNRSTSESNHIIDTDVGPQGSGSGATADLLGANRDSSGALVDGDVGQHQGPSLVDANVGTNADSFQFPSLDGSGLDSLVGEVGGIGDIPGVGDIAGVGGTNLLPVSAGVDGNVLAQVDLTGDVSAGDNNIDDGTHIMLNTPLQGQGAII